MGIQFTDYNGADQLSADAFRPEWESPQEVLREIARIDSKSVCRLISDADNAATVS